LLEIFKKVTFYPYSKFTTKNKLTFRKQILYLALDFSIVTMIDLSILFKKKGFAMNEGWLIFLPPILVMLIAFTTHRIMLALSLGIFSASFLATHHSLLNAIKLSFSSIWQTTGLSEITKPSDILNNENLMLFFFMFFLGIITTMIIKAGGAMAFQELRNFPAFHNDVFR